MGAICSGPEPIRSQAKQFSQAIKQAEQQRRYEEAIYEATHDSHGKRIATSKPHTYDPYDPNPNHHPPKSARSHASHHSGTSSPRRKSEEFGRVKSGGSDEAPKTARSHRSNASKNSADHDVEDSHNKPGRGRRKSVDHSADDDQFKSARGRRKSVDHSADDDQFKSTKGRRKSVDHSSPDAQFRSSGASRGPSGGEDNRSRRGSPEQSPSRDDFGRTRSHEHKSKKHEAPSEFGRARSNPVDEVDQFASIGGKNGDHHARNDVAAEFASHKAERYHQKEQRKHDVSTTVTSTRTRKLHDPPKRRNSATLLQGSFTEHHHPSTQPLNPKGAESKGGRLIRKSSSFKMQDLPAYSMQNDSPRGKDGLLSSIGFDVSFRKMGIRDTLGHGGPGKSKDELDWLNKAANIHKPGYRNDELRKMDKQLAGMAANFKSL